MGRYKGNFEISVLFFRNHGIDLDFRHFPCSRWRLFVTSLFTRCFNFCCWKASEAFVKTKIKSHCVPSVSLWSSEWRGTCHGSCSWCQPSSPPAPTSDRLSRGRSSPCRCSPWPKYKGRSAGERRAGKKWSEALVSWKNGPNFGI